MDEVISYKATNYFIFYYYKYSYFNIFLLYKQGWSIGGEVQYNNDPQFCTSVDKIVNKNEVDKHIDKTIKKMDKKLKSNFDENI